MIKVTASLVTERRERAKTLTPRGPRVSHLHFLSVSMDRFVLPRTLSRALAVPHIGHHQSHAVATWAHMGPCPYHAKGAATAWGLRLLPGPHLLETRRREVRLRASSQQQPAPLSGVQQRQRRRDAAEIVEVHWARRDPSPLLSPPLPASHEGWGPSSFCPLASMRMG